MEAAPTTVAVQRYLDELNLARPDSLAETAVRDVLSHAARRLHVLSAALLRRSYGRLTRAPMNLQAEELLSAVVERLLKALHEARPKNVRMFFALANQHMRWELNALARQLDEQAAPAALHEEAVAQPLSSSDIGANARRILAAIESLPAEEREVFELVRLQDLTHHEVAEIVTVSTKTVQRRLNRALVLLTSKVGDLRVTDEATDSAE
jgi:RNA polymerase sigma-70 factor (ECF subfamily)